MTSISKTERAHQKYRSRHYAEALELYTEALNAATLLNHQIALHSNRAACYLKLQQFKPAAEECSAVLELDAKHAGALMLRAQTLVAMQDYHSALFELNRLLETNPESEVYRNLRERLRTQMALAPIPEADSETPPDSPSHQPMRKLPVLAGPPPKPVGWAAIPKPKGHTGVDYSCWSGLGDDISSAEEEEEEQPQYAYRLKNVGLSNIRVV